MERIDKAFDIRGTRFGGDTPLLCSPLVGRTPAALLAEARSVVALQPDLVEWRVDHFESIADTAAVLDTARALRAVAGERPILFTRRSVREGGAAIAIGDAEVVDLYAAVSASRQVDLIDFEMGNDPAHVRSVRQSTQADGTRLILSYHNFVETPDLDFMVGRFLQAEQLGADVAKVAVMPRSRMDVLTLLAATAQADDRTRIPLVSMSMGPLGSVTRMVGGLFGSCLSFAVGASASAPGQMPIADLVTVFDIVRRARGNSAP